MITALWIYGLIGLLVFFVALACVADLQYKANKIQPGALALAAVLAGLFWPSVLFLIMRSAIVDD